MEQCDTTTFSSHASTLVYLSFSVQVSRVIRTADRRVSDLIVAAGAGAVWVGRRLKERDLIAFFQCAVKMGPKGDSASLGGGRVLAGWWWGGGCDEVIRGVPGGWCCVVPAN